VLFSNGPNKAFLVPDSCRATVRNVSAYTLMSQMTQLKTISTNLVSAIFSQFGSCIGLFDIAG